MARLIFAFLLLSFWLVNHPKLKILLKNREK